MDLKNFDINTLKKYTNAQSVKDLDKFLDALPVTAGYNALIAAGLTWVIAGLAILFATTETAKVAELRAQLLEVENLKPPVPSIDYVPLNKTAIQTYLDKIDRIELYPILTLSSPSDGKLDITGSDTEFTAMTYAIGHIQGGGRNWHVDLDSLCVGRECQGGSLKASLKISTIRINEDSQGAGDDI